MGCGTEYERAYLVGLRPIFDRGRSRGLGITFLSSAGESQRATESSDGPPVFWKAASRGASKRPAEG